MHAYISSLQLVTLWNHSIWLLWKPLSKKVKKHHHFQHTNWYFSEYYSNHCQVWYNFKRRTRQVQIKNNVRAVRCWYSDLSISNRWVKVLIRSKSIVPWPILIIHFKSKTILTIGYFINLQVVPWCHYDVTRKCHVNRVTWCNILKS